MSELNEERATDRAERHLIEKIVSGTFPPNTDLPGERTLSKDLDLARPALREAMQRLSRDGWLDIQQGKPTRIRDYLKDGNIKYPGRSAEGGSCSGAQPGAGSAGYVGITGPPIHRFLGPADPGFDH